MGLVDKIRAWKHEVERINAAQLVHSFDAADAKILQLLGVSGSGIRYL